MICATIPFTHSSLTTTSMELPKKLTMAKTSHVGRQLTHVSTAPFLGSCGMCLQLVPPDECPGLHDSFYDACVATVPVGAVRAPSQAKKPRPRR